MCTGIYVPTSLLDSLHYSEFILNDRRRRLTFQQRETKTNSKHICQLQTCGCRRRTWSESVGNAGIGVTSQLEAERGEITERRDLRNTNVPESRMKRLQRVRSDVATSLPSREFIVCSRDENSVEL